MLLKLLKMSIERVETSSMYNGIMLALFLKKNVTSLMDPVLIEIR